MCYVLVVWTNMSDHPYTVERGENFVALHTKGWEEEDYFSSGVYEAMLTDNQLHSLTGDRV